jgi:L-lysine 2,3-aminomutase
MKYQSYTLRNFKEIPQLKDFDKADLFNMEVVGSILPFKTNNYVVDELIDWENYAKDPIFCLNFPQKEMLKPDH